MLSIDGQPICALVIHGAKLMRRRGSGKSQMHGDSKREEGHAPGDREGVSRQPKGPHASNALLMRGGVCVFLFMQGGSMCVRDDGGRGVRRCARSEGEAPGWAGLGWALPRSATTICCYKRLEKGGEEQ